MTATNVARFGGIIRVIGYLIVIPSLLGVAFAGLMCASTANVTNELMAEAVTAAERSGTVIGAGISYGVSLVIGASSLVGGLVGWLLLLKHKVYRCERCGFLLERA